MRRRASSVLLAILVSVPVGAAAQSTNAQPRVEVGGGFGLLVDPNGVLKGFGPRVTVNVNDRIAVESGFEINQNWHRWPSSLLGGVHVTQVKYAVRPGDATHARVFLTGGFLGFFAHEHVDGFEYTSYDGTVDSIASRTDGYWAQRLTPTIGVGVEHSLARHVGWRADVLAGHHADGVLLRASFGVTIPIGHYNR